MRQLSVRIDVLEIGYLEAGPADGPVAILMHGFPYDALGCTEAGEMLAAEGWRVLIPWMRGYGPTRFLDPATPRSGEQAAFGADLLGFMDALQIDRATLAGFDWGGRAACIVAAMWPDRVAGLVSCGGYNIMNPVLMREPASADQESRLWYCWYFHSARGAIGLERNRQDICRHIWKLWSPSWAFTEEEFLRSAVAFDNPDFVDVVIHSYRHRFELVEGDPAHAELDRLLAQSPVIDVPAYLIQGEDDGVDPRRTFYEAPFPQLRGTAIVAGGHNPIQENPRAIVEAIHAVSVAR